MQITCGFFYYFILFILILSTIESYGTNTKESGSLNSQVSEDVPKIQDSGTIFRMARQEEDEDEEDTPEANSNRVSSNQNQTSAFDVFFLQLLPAVNGLGEGFITSLKESPIGNTVKGVEEFVDVYKKKFINRHFQIYPYPSTPKLENPPQRVLEQTSPLPVPITIITSTRKVEVLSTTSPQPLPDIDLGAFTTTTKPTTKKPYNYYYTKINVNEIPTQNQNSYEDYDEPNKPSFQVSPVSPKVIMKPKNKEPADEEIIIDEEIIEPNTVEPTKLAAYISKYQYHNVTKNNG